MLVQVTIYRRLLNGRDGHLDQSEVRYIVASTRIRPLVRHTHPATDSHTHTLCRGFHS